jgi:hypothetical protein
MRIDFDFPQCQPADWPDDWQAKTAVIDDDDNTTLTIAYADAEFVKPLDAYVLAEVRWYESQAGAGND